MPVDSQWTHVPDDGTLCYDFIIHFCYVTFLCIKFFFLFNFTFPGIWFIVLQSQQCKNIFPEGNCHSRRWHYEGWNWLNKQFSGLVRMMSEHLKEYFDVSVCFVSMLQGIITVTCTSFHIFSYLSYTDIIYW